jgi:hypothetical protein
MEGERREEVSGTTTQRSEKSRSVRSVKCQLLRELARDAAAMGVATTQTVEWARVGLAHNDKSQSLTVDTVPRELAAIWRWVEWYCGGR